MSSVCGGTCVSPTPDPCPPESCCAATGYDYHEWPEFVGKGAVAATGEIISKFPNLLVCQMLGGNNPKPTDVCCNRVILVVDINNVIVELPKTG